MEQLNLPANATPNDDANANAILVSLEASVQALHTKDWALHHLAVGARVMIQKKLTPYATIRAFLEAAVPVYDRNGAPIPAKKGWRYYSGRFRPPLA